MGLIFGFLERYELRGAACECIAGIIEKKMSPESKMNLLRTLNIIAVIKQLPTVSYMSVAKQQDNDDFAEKVAKLANVIGLECRVVWDTSNEKPELQALAYQSLQELVPFALHLLAFEDSDVSLVVVPFVESMVYMVRILF